MFTGIVETCVPITRVEAAGTGSRIWLPVPMTGESREPWVLEDGQSVAVSGVCLSVAAREPGHVAFDLSRETLERTSFEAAREGQTVNLERAMKLGDRLDGHLVSGHVDGGATVVEIEDVGDGGRMFRFELDAGLERYLIEKGSICLDGISLTVVEPQDRAFGVAVIPITLTETNLGSARVGQRVNVEVDMIGKWIERLSLPTG